MPRTANARRPTSSTPAAALCRTSPLVREASVSEMGLPALTAAPDRTVGDDTTAGMSLGRCLSGVHPFGACEHRAHMMTSQDVARPQPRAIVTPAVRGLSHLGAGPEDARRHITAGHRRPSARSSDSDRPVSRTSALTETSTLSRSTSCFVDRNLAQGHGGGPAVRSEPSPAFALMARSAWRLGRLDGPGRRRRSTSEPAVASSPASHREISASPIRRGIWSVSKPSVMQGGGGSPVGQLDAIRRTRRPAVCRPPAVRRTRPCT